MGNRRTALVLATVFCLASLAACGLVPKKKPTPVIGEAPPGRERGYAVEGKVYYPLKHAEGFEETGTASWYGRDFHGRKTSNGETYNMYALSAAHQILPFDTVVLVRNLQNGRQVKARINDRGPFVAGRIIDLSYAAAKELGMLESGTARVQVTALGKERIALQEGSTEVVYVPEPDYSVGHFSVQIGSFASKDNAQRLVEKVKTTFEDAYINEFDRGDLIFYQVRVARTTTLDAAREKVNEVRAMGFADSFAVADQ